MRTWCIAFVLLTLAAVSCSGDYEVIVRALPNESVVVVASETATVEVASNGAFEFALETQDIAIRSLSIRANKAGREAKIEVARLSGKPIDLDSDANADVYQYLQIDVEALDNEAISSVAIDFSVSVRWLESRGHDEKNIILKRFEGKWTALPTSVTDRNSDSVHFRAVSPGLSIFAIAVDEPDNSSDESPTPSPAAAILTATPTTPSVISTPTPLPTATPVSLPSSTPSPSVTATLTSTAVPPATATASPTITATMTAEPSSTATHTPTPSATPTVTITPAASATATQLPTATLTPSPSPTPTATPSPTPTATPQSFGGGSGGGGTATPTPMPSNTPVPIATNTPLPTATSTPIPTSTPTLTPTPTGDERYGVVLHTSSKFENDYFLDQMGLNWYLNFGSAMSQVPDGANKLPFVQVPKDSTVWNSGQAESIETLSDEQIAGLGFQTRTQIQQMAQNSPGTYWYIFGEANRYGYMTGKRFAPVFHYFVTQLKLGDPTAKIVGTSILNWDFTCIGCAGYQSGEVWLQSFVSEYALKYGENPPVDVWAIDVYPIDWNNTPNNDPGKLAFYSAKGGNFPHWSIAIQQLQGMRAYLDSVPGYASTPMWITEIAVHVGYDGWGWITFPTEMAPTGAYHWDLMSDYLSSVLDWLEANAASKLIEKWFFFSSWKDIVNVGSDGYMGISFYDGPGVGANLTCLGDVYRARALSESPVQCDANGNTIPQ